jgi:uncharacterized protein (TIRG00374 family)
VRRKLAFVVKLSLGVLLVALLARKVAWAELRGLVAAADARLLAVGLAITLLNFPIGAARWHVLLKPLTRDVSYLETLRLVFVAHFFNVFLPGGIAGDVVRGLAARRPGLAGADAFGSVVTDRLMALVAWIVIAGVGLAFGWRELVASGLHTYAAAAGALVLALTAALYSRRIGRRFAGLARLVGRAGEQLAQLQDSLRGYRGWRGTLASAFAWTLLSHAFMIASIAALALAIGARAPLVAFISFVPIIAIVSALPLTWGGLGLRDAGFVLLFPSAGMTRAEALGTSLLFLATILVAAVVGGLVSLLPAPARQAEPSAPEAAPVTSPRRE